MSPVYTEKKMNIFQGKDNYNQTTVKNVTISWRNVSVYAVNIEKTICKQLVNNGLLKYQF